jgi:hypothetical protein
LIPLNLCTLPLPLLSSRWLFGHPSWQQSMAISGDQNRALRKRKGQKKQYVQISHFPHSPQAARAFSFSIITICPLPHLSLISHSLSGHINPPPLSLTQSPTFPRNRPLRILAESTHSYVKNGMQSKLQLTLQNVLLVFSLLPKLLVKKPHVTPSWAVKCPYQSLI